MIESFRTMEQYHEERFLAELRGKPSEMSWQALTGTAFHELLAHPEKYNGGSLYAYHGRLGTYTWDAEQVNKILATIDRRGVMECKIVADRTVEGTPVQLVAKADFVLGSCVTDYKCKFGSWSTDDYAPSAQWRLYLDMFGCESFEYRVFEMKEPDEANHVVIKSMDDFRFYRYAALEHDCQQMLEDFVRWLKANGLPNGPVNPWGGKK